MSKLEISGPYIQDWPDIDTAIADMQIVREKIRYVKLEAYASAGIFRLSTATVVLHDGQSIPLEVPEGPVRYQRKSE